MKSKDQKIEIIRKWINEVDCFHPKIHVPAWQAEFLLDKLSD